MKAKREVFNKLIMIVGSMLVVFIMTSCADELAPESEMYASQANECIDESKISDGPCTYEYNPVCGCDGKTYGNACAAERNGVTSWTAGKCN